MTLRRPRAAGIAAALVLGLSVGLTACAQSPETSYVNDAGESVTVNWRDYPAVAWIDADLVLEGPTVEEAAERSAELLAEVREALRAEFGAEEWQTLGEAEAYDDWFPMGGNGYGGDSMLITNNSQTWESEVSIPRSDWERVVNAAAEIAARHGLEMRVEQELDSDWETWMRAENLLRGDAEWLSITVQDATLDAEALEQAVENGWLVSGISLSTGITTIREEDRVEFERRAAPFRDLVRPEPTHSD